MKTLQKIEGLNTSFFLADVAPECQEAVRGLYYVPVEEGFAKTYPSETPHLERIYQNFARSADEMVLQAARLHPVAWEEALAAFLQLSRGAGIDWWLTGSAALAVRGVEVLPGDLDLVVDKAGAFRLAELLADDLVEPLQPTQGWISAWFGRAFLHARREWVGEVNACADQPLPSDFGPTAASRLEVVDWRDFPVRVPPLELQLAVSQRRGLTARVAAIQRFLQKGG